MHRGRRVVVRKLSTVPSMTSHQRRCSPRGILPKGHVSRSVEALAGSTVQLATQGLSTLVVEKGGLVAMVQNQPQLEAWIGHSDPNTLVGGQLQCPVEMRMILRPLDVENAPAFVDLWIVQLLGGCPHQGQRYSTGGIDDHIERRVRSDLRKALQCVDVVGLRGFAFTEDDDSATFRSIRRCALEVLGSGTSGSHRVNRSGRARATVRCGRCRATRRIDHANRPSPD